MKNNKKWLKGSYTVEASFLLPVILSVIVLVIYLSFYLHDRAVLSSAAYTAALRGSQMKEGSDIAGDVTKQAEELIRNRLLGTTEVETRVESNGSSIVVSYGGTVRIPGGALLCKYLTGGKDYIPVQASAKAATSDAVSFIRRIRVLKAYGKAIE